MRDICKGFLILGGWVEEEPSFKECIALGCTNKTNEGEFVGDLCAPCHRAVTTGVTTNTVFAKFNKEEKVMEDKDCPSCKYCEVSTSKDPCIRCCWGRGTHSADMLWEAKVDIELKRSEQAICKFNYEVMDAFLDGKPVWLKTAAHDWKEVDNSCMNTIQFADVFAGQWCLVNPKPKEKKMEVVHTFNRFVTPAQLQSLVADATCFCGTATSRHAEFTKKITITVEGEV